MSKRRIPQRTVAEIGENRISRLLDLSEEAVRANKPDRARRYVTVARRIGMKTRVKMPVDRRYCKECMVPLIHGVNCSVRLSNHKVCITCGMCGTVRRLPYIKEQRK